MTAPAGASSLSLGGILGVLSLGVDLGLGQPMEHMLRECVISLELAERMGLDDSSVEIIYFLALLAYVGCHTDSHEQAHWFGDDIALRENGYLVDQTPRGQMRLVMSQLGAGSPALGRARTIAAFMSSGRKEAEGMKVGHCNIAARFASRLGLRDEVGEALLQVFERFDGHGTPGEVSGTDIQLPVRLFHLADVTEVFHRIGGVDAAVEVARSRSGTQFDPAVVEVFCENAPDVLGRLAEPLSWESVVSSQPSLSEELSDEDVVTAIEAIADYVDLKSPYTLGHSRAVADLATKAAHEAGLPDDQIDAVRGAGLLHDLGRLGISNAIWDKKGPLTPAEQERVRLQPYLTERMVSASPALAPIAPLASAHQERLDGSGYPRGLKGDALSRAARILSAADVYRALVEPRPYRPARSAEDAAAELRAEARSARLDGEAVDAVLKAAGHAVTRRPEQPAGLTRREIEVLGLLARGLQSKEIAERLHITPKTVGHHISHIYTKIGASNRVAASVYATEHGLLG